MAPARAALRTGPSMAVVAAAPALVGGRLRDMMPLRGAAGPASDGVEARGVACASGSALWGEEPGRRPSGRAGGRRLRDPEKSTRDRSRRRRHCQWRSACVGGGGDSRPQPLRPRRVRHPPLAVARYGWRTRRQRMWGGAPSLSQWPWTASAFARVARCQSSEPSAAAEAQERGTTSLVLMGPFCLPSLCP